MKISRSNGLDDHRELEWLLWPDVHIPMYSFEIEDLNIAVVPPVHHYAVASRVVARRVSVYFEAAESDRSGRSASQHQQMDFGRP